ncbi:MAG: hypothetical protein AB8B63_08335 [Granulosicoccus sp.]
MKLITIRLGGLVRKAALITAFCASLGAGMAQAQQNLNTEQIERQLQQLLSSLAEAEANRQATGAQAEQIRKVLVEHEKHKANVEAELEALCKEQEELKPGTYDNCISSL